MRLAIEAYISRVNKSPCGDTVISLYPGADSTEEQEVCKKLLIFLKGSNAKRALCTQEPNLYANFELVWRFRDNHMVRDLPSYLFFLLCCFKDGCPHPRCQVGPPQSPLTWYPEGPPLSQLPLPVADPQRTWVGPCDSCEGLCSGHYM